MSEPVSGNAAKNSLLAGKIQGISSIRASAARRLWAKKAIRSVPYGPILYASEQGIFCGLTGNLIGRSGKISP